MKYLTLTGLSRFFSNLRKIIPSKTSELQNDSGFITSQQIPDITGYSKSEVDDLLDQKATDSATVHKQGNETISGLKQFTSGLYLKHPTHSGNDAPQSNITLDGIDFTSTDKIWGQLTYKWNTDGSTSLLLSVQNYNSSNAGQTDIDFVLSKDLSSCYLAPSDNNFVSLGTSSNQWKSVYAQNYYLGSTAFGDIVTHNASEFLTEHQSLSNYVTLDGAQTISGEKTFTTFPIVKPTHANNGIIKIKSPTTFGTAPSTTTYTYALRCVDNEDTILADFLAQQSTNGANSIQLRVRNTDGTLVYDRRVSLSVRGTDGYTNFSPNADNLFYLGTADYKWKSVYANSYYLGTTAFGDIVTHNASEFLTSHQSLSNYVTTNTEQTVTGNKEFASNSYVTVRGYRFRIKNDSMVLGTVPSSNQWTGIQFVDSNYAPISEILQSFQRNGNSLYQINVYPNEADSEKRALLAYTYNSSNGTNYVGFSSSLIPLSTNAYYLGTTSNKWQSVYADNYYGTSASFSYGIDTGCIEINPTQGRGDGGYIDFHYNSSTADFTSRIIENASGQLDINGIKFLSDASYLGVKIEGATVDLNDLYSSAKGATRIYYATTNGGTNNITNKPVGQAFILYSHTVRYQSASDYIIEQLAYGATTIYFRSCTNGTWTAWKTLSLSDHTHSQYLTAHQTVSNSAPTLAWGTTSTIGTIGGTALTVKMPANPNTNTTYSAGTGLSLSGTTFSLALTKDLVTSALGYTPPTQDTTYSNFVKSGSGAKAGLVPSPGTTAGTTKYLREDGTWQVPPDHTYTVNNATLTIQKNGSNVATFTSNASSNVTANITVPTKTSEITNDSGFITSSSNITGTSANVTGTVAIAHGGTGATTRLGAVKALTEENVGTSTEYFLTITNSWGKAGYCSVANAKTVLGLKSGAYADAYTHPTSAGNKHIPSGGASGNFLVYSAAGTAAWGNTVSSVTVTNNASNGIKFGSYTVYVG